MISPAKRYCASRAHFSFDNPFYRGLGERDIAALYLLMARLFPRNDEARARHGLYRSLELGRLSPRRHSALPGKLGHRSRRDGAERADRRTPGVRPIWPTI